MCEPWGHVHVAASNPEALHTTIPLMFHYDGAESFRNQEEHIWSCGSPLVSGGDVFDRVFPLLLLMTSQIPTPSLRQQAEVTFVNFLKWSLGICRVGIMPSVGYSLEAFAPGSSRADAAGKRIANDYTFAFSGWLGDRKARVECHSLSRYYRCTLLCELCDAVTPNLNVDHHFSFCDCSSKALWRTTYHSHDSFVRFQNATTPWLIGPGFHFLLLWDDVMRNGLLGHARSSVASAIAHMLLDNVLPPVDNRDEALLQLSIEFRLYCRVNKLRCPPRPFTLGLIGWTAPRVEFPEISSLVKAAHMRTVICFVATKARDVCDGTAASKHRSLLLWALADFYHCCDHSSRILDDESAHRLHFAATAYVLAYQSLSHLFKSRSELLYKMTPKLHYFCHLEERAYFGRFNPNLFSCFGYEDFVGRISRITKKVHASLAPKRTFQRWLLYIGHRWHLLLERGRTFIRTTIISRNLRARNI